MIVVFRHHSYLSPPFPLLPGHSPRVLRQFALRLPKPHLPLWPSIIVILPQPRVNRMVRDSSSSLCLATPDSWRSAPKSRPKRCYVCLPGRRWWPVHGRSRLSRRLTKTPLFFILLRTPFAPAARPRPPSFGHGRPLRRGSAERARAGPQAPCGDGGLRQSSFRPDRPGPF